MNRILKNVFYSGIQDRLGPEDQVKLLFINSIIFFGLAMLTFFGLLDVYHGDPMLGSTTLAVGAVVFALYFTIRALKSYLIGVWFLPFFMLAFFSYLTYTGGAKSTTVLWMLTYPVIVVFLAGANRGAIFSGVFLVLQLVLLFVPGLSPASEIEPEFKLRLLGVYVILFTFSMAFETIRLRAQTELAKTAAELASAKVQTDGILTNITEGIFVLDSDLRVGPHHSRSLTGLLQVENPVGKSLPELLRGSLADRENDAARDYLEMFFQPNPPWHLLDDLNPLEEATLTSADGARRHLTFSFSSVELSGRRVLGTVRDVTQERELDARLKVEEDRAARQMRYLFQIIHVKPELLLQFLHDAEEDIVAVNRKLKDPHAVPEALIEELYQGLHSVKGNASLIGLTSFAERVHDLESSVAQFRAAKPTWQDFLEITVRLSVIQAELTEIRTLLDQMAAFQQDLQALGEGKDLLLLALEKAVDTLKRDTGKSVDLDVSTFGAELVPERHRKLIKDVLIQMVRNSFVHGLEPEPERRAAGKRPQARIRVAITAEQTRLTLKYADDGRGFDVEALRKAAGSSVSDTEAVNLAFEPGVSTVQEPSLNAGRGVGLGLVKASVETAQGRLRFRSVPGKGVAFDITLPMP